MLIKSFKQQIGVVLDAVILLLVIGGHYYSRWSWLS